MIRITRVLGYLLGGTGILILLGSLISPLRALWPFFRSLSPPVQFALAAVFFGFLLVLASLIAERMEDAAEEGNLGAD